MVKQQYSMKKHTIIILSVICSMLVSHGVAARSPNQKRSLSSCAGFISYEAIGTLLDNYETTYSQIARSFSIGTSVEEREIYALLISNNPDIESAEPEIRIIGAIHGDECQSVETVLEIIEWLLSSYGDDSFVSNLVDETEILFVPLVNPDGYSSSAAQRENANLVDLNRNFGFAWFIGGSSPFSEPEARAIVCYLST